MKHQSYDQFCEELSKTKNDMAPPIMDPLLSYCLLKLTKLGSNIFLQNNAAKHMVNALVRNKLFS
jgi:hypothetical protein